MPIDRKLLDDVALSAEEYNLIVERLGREPGPVELGMLGSLWSEHCGYKHSKLLLKLFPSQGPHVLIPPGEENAGVVDIGGGLAVAFKMESHNHPSAIEPYQGAATGVGGIVRDIFAMGARPIALMNSLRFGPLSEARNRYLFTGVVAGIAGYGNCLGIPDVGGEACFDATYSHNPLINVFCLGLVEIAKLQRGCASGAGNALMLVGSDTGRDGIHGASGLASRTFEEERELRPTVQVGNPFLEKLLMEACLELAGTDYIEGLQDLGAAGLTSAAVEAVARGGAGLNMDIALVTRREEGMTPYEVMLSESQERMLAIVRRGREAEAQALFEKWGLNSVVIGRVTDDSLATVRDGEQVVARLPISLLTTPPLYRLQGRKPPELDQLQNIDLSRLPDLPRPASEVLLRLLASPTIASKEWVYRQYDHQVLTNTVVGPGSDAAILRVKGTQKGIALTCDGNGRLCYLDPHIGGARAVAEAARNLVCAGARPLALTDCLNFGNPERPEVYYQLEQAILGMSEACRALETPVVSGNVSLYNETRGQAVYPTPVVGMVGLLEDIDKRCPMGFQGEGDAVYLLGPMGAEASHLAGSEYLALEHGLVAGQPAIDLDMEVQVQRRCLEAIQRGLLRSAHDCSEGGLAVALAESAIAGGMGFTGEFELSGRRDAALFGEAPSRIVVSVQPGQEEELQALAQSWKVPLLRLGRVRGRQFLIPDLVDLDLETLSQAWRRGLERALG
ncbi:MAG: phosphoribosylformylglycinamidine synthase subunit PurL [Chloroflexi bacterium]|nr:phosphoribosylformylglycinamidine synthase subunit PurL [Chloroflexota bacterium]